MLNIKALSLISGIHKAYHHFFHDYTGSLAKLIGTEEEM